MDPFGRNRHGSMLATAGDPRCLRLKRETFRRLSAPTMVEFLGE